MDKLETTGRWLLGGGALAFGAWGLFRPATLAKAMGIGPRAARMLGVRDTASGLLIALSGGPSAYAVRSVCDFADAAVTVRRKPGVAVGALCFGLLAASAARATRH